MIKKVEELEKEHATALAVLKRAKASMESEEFDAVRKARELARSRWNESMEIFQKEEAAALAALVAAKDEAAKAGEGALVPIGEIYEEFNFRQFSSHRYPTGKKAVSVLWTSEMRCQQTSQSPAIGDTALVVLKSNGERSLRAMRIARGHKGEIAIPYGWMKMEKKHE